MEKKDRGQRPVINLKSLNFFVHYEHFKMESLSSLQFLLKIGDYMAKQDLKDAYFCVPLHKESRKFVQFPWNGKLYEFLCLYFGLCPAPRIFTKLLNVPLAVLRRLNMLIIIYLDDMLIIGRTRKEVESTRDTHLPFATFRVSSQFKEICASTMSGNRISGPYSKFFETDSLTLLT